MRKYSQQSSDNALTLMATLPDIQTSASNHVIKRGNVLCGEEMSNQVFAMRTRRAGREAKLQGGASSPGSMGLSAQSEEDDRAIQFSRFYPFWGLSTAHLWKLLPSPAY